MNTVETILKPIKNLRGGAKIPHHKNTAEVLSVVMRPEKVYIPLSQNIGAPCEATVSVGDQVFVGTKIGDSEAFVSAPVHSGVSGTVTAITDKEIDGRKVTFIEIESDGNFTPDPNLKPFPVNCAADLAKAARECGLVGLGGAGFPTHVKLTIKEGTKIDTLIVNGAECEPYITADYRECMENSHGLMECIYLLKEKLGLERVIIGVESNKPEAIKILREIAADKRDENDTVKVMKLPSRYPQGAEKIIIHTTTGRVLPLGKLPSDIGCIVMNITSLGALYKFITTGMPLVSKRITFDGTAAINPQNIIAPIGTAISDIIEFAGGVSEDADKIILGGPMMGNSILSDSHVIDKRTNAVLVMKEEKPLAATPCIRCGRCADACTMNLYPAMVEAANRTGNTAAYEQLNVNYCMECGSCSFVCPAKRPLTQIMRVAKAELRRNTK